eukprot:SAG11_NODE_890_length_6689_cov_18.947951_5_plen_84_part_00
MRKRSELVALQRRQCLIGSAPLSDAPAQAVVLPSGLIHSACLRYSSDRYDGDDRLQPLPRCIRAKHEHLQTFGGAKTVLQLRT